VGKRRGSVEGVAGSSARDIARDNSITRTTTHGDWFEARVLCTCGLVCWRCRSPHAVFCSSLTPFSAHLLLHLHSIVPQFSDQNQRQEKEEFDSVEDTKASKKTGGVGLEGFGLGLGDWLATDLGTGPNLRGFGGDSTDGERSSDDEGGSSKRHVTKRSPNSPSKGGWGKGGGWGRGGASYWDPAGLSVDLRSGLLELPQGLTVIDSKGANVNTPDLKFEEQADSNMALVIRNETLRMSLGPSHNLYSWTTEKDGKVHSYTLNFAIKLEKLPSSNRLLFHGRGMAAEAVAAGSGKTPKGGAKTSEQASKGPSGGKSVGGGRVTELECVQIYKNGGVGALGQVGTATTAIKAECWSWVTVTRNEGELKTFVNGRLCAQVKLEPIRVVDGVGGEEGAESEQKKKTKSEGKERVNDAFAIDPADFALFLPQSRAVDDTTSASEFVGLDGEEEGAISVKYVSLVCETMDEEKIRAKIHGLRGADEFLEAQEKAQEDKCDNLVLHKLYAKPPPIWLHPCFAGLFGDSFIEGTGLEFGGVFTTLQVFNLVFAKLLKHEGVRMGGRAEMYPHSLQHPEWQELNAIFMGFTESVKVAHLFQKSIENKNQHRQLMVVLMSKLEAMQIGEVLLVPHAISDKRETSPILFVVDKISDDLATFIVVNTNPELLYFHPAQGQPPKIKYKTCMVLENVAFDKLKDEAFWGLAYWVATSPEDASQTMRPVEVLYKILLPFLQGKSLEEIQHSQSSSSCELRSPQRAETGHLRCLIEAFQYLMRRRGLAVAARKEVSLLLRLEMFELVMHDMMFVQQLSSAERTLLHIACRQIGYTTSKLGRMLNPDKTDVLSLEQVSAIAKCIDSLRQVMGGLPSGDSAADIAPPPLILCEAEAELMGSSIVSLLGASLVSLPDTGGDFYTVLGVARDADEEDIAKAYKKKALLHHPDKNPNDVAAAEARFKNVHEAFEGIKEGRIGKLETIDSLAALSEAQVIGIYFTASWCGPCRAATPVLAESYKQLQKKHGKAFEMVCVSHDQSEVAFQRYFQKMPWLALPFQSLQKTVLGELFKVEGIPTLILLDSKGKVISRDGLRLLSRHPNAFPWNAKAPELVPHQHSLFDRLLRHEDVDAGPQQQLRSYAPVDYLQQPAQVTCLDAAIAALRYCDRLCTRVRVQEHCIKNGHFQFK